MNKIQKQTMHLRPEKILKFLLGTNEDVDTLIMCRGTEIDFITYDYELYEAIGAIKAEDSFKLNRLIKLLEVVDVVSYRKNTGKEKPVLTHGRVDELRKEAFKNIKSENP